MQVIRKLKFCSFELSPFGFVVTSLNAENWKVKFVSKASTAEAIQQYVFTHEASHI
jgi:hypothetical protein